LGADMMQFKTNINDRIFACNNEYEGVFELIRGAYIQHRGNSQTPRFKTEYQFRRYVLKICRKEN
jgi:hypothetical protein